MKLFSYIFLSILCFTSFSVSAQRTVEIPPDSIGIINAVITGDTTETGERVDPNTVYILQRDAIYKTIGEITNEGYHLTIQAADGPGSMPIIQPAVETGGISVRPFTVLGNLTLEGLYVTSIDDLGTYINRIIRVRADSMRVELKNCWLDGSGQSVVRIDNVGGKVFIEDCIISHIGRTFVPNNGRVVDFRTNGDSLVVKNSTFYNITQRLLRATAGRAIRYAEFRNNTIVNIAQIVADFEECGSIKFIDNLVVNGEFEGSTRGQDLLSIEVMTDENKALLGITEQEADVRNNWFYTTPDVLEVWADSITFAPLYDGLISELMGVDSLTLVNDLTGTGPVQFKSPPPLPQNVVVGMIFDQLFADNPDNGSAPNWNFTSSPFFQVIDGSLAIPGWEFPFNFSYSSSSGAATFSTIGGPVGDPRWPLEEFSIITNLEALLEREKMMIFPNPAHDQFHVQVVENRSVVEIEVFDVAGFSVFQPGRNINNNQLVDISTLTRGVYFVKVVDDKGKTHIKRLIKN